MRPIRRHRHPALSRSPDAATMTRLPVLRLSPAVAFYEVGAAEAQELLIAWRHPLHLPDDDIPWAGPTRARSGDWRLSWRLAGAWPRPWCWRAPSIERMQRAWLRVSPAVAVYEVGAGGAPGGGRCYSRGATPSTCPTMTSRGPPLPAPVGETGVCQGGWGAPVSMTNAS